jgi:hypothetical protein
MATEIVPPYQNNPGAVLSRYMSLVQRPVSEKSPEIKHRPTIDMIKMAEKILKNSGFQETPSAISQITSELTHFKKDDLLLGGSCTTTDLLSVMFLYERKRLPERWLENDDIMRTIVSMAANNDIAYYKNRILDTRYHEDLSTAARRSDSESIQRLEQLIDDLQARVSISPGSQLA